MSFNKRISKFLVGLTLASSVVSSMGCMQVFAMESLRDNIRRMAFQKAINDLDNYDIDTLSGWIDWGTDAQKNTAKSLIWCSANYLEERKIKEFFDTLDRVCTKPEDQPNNTLDKVIICVKSIFDSDSKDDKADLKKRLRGYYAVLFYFDIKQSGLNVPKFITDIVQKFDSDGDIQTKILELCSY